MKIGFFGLEDWEEKYLKEAFPSDQLTLSKEKIDELNLPKEKDFEILSVFVNSKLTKEILEEFPKLKLISTRSTGFDHIDAKECKKRNIKVAYVPEYGSRTVAEFTFGLILSLTRKIYQSIDQIKETESFSLFGLSGMDLENKNIGIIGTGKIGREVIKIAKAFSMNILAYDPYPNEKLKDEYGVKYIELSELLKNSDIITLHCPHNKNTHHLINKENIKNIKKGAFLINTARGALIDTQALVKALDGNILAGAGLDVLEEEGEIKDELNFLVERHPNEDKLKNMILDHVLMKMPNVLITPHNAFNSKEALKRILNTTIKNIENFKKEEFDKINLIPENN